MPAIDEKPLDGEDTLEPPSTTQGTSLHSVALSGMPMHIYPYTPALLPTQQPVRSKRRQVKNACTNCQKACKKCDDARPCLRCVKYGISEECVDSQRKERQKGIKRGPYKKRDGRGASRCPLFFVVMCGMT
jgi:Fungal Zn(2)-Cys(6) binuclear cluster domain